MCKFVVVAKILTFLECSLLLVLQQGNVQTGIIHNGNTQKMRLHPKKKTITQRIYDSKTPSLTLASARF